MEMKKSQEGSLVAEYWRDDQEILRGMTKRDSIHYLLLTGSGCVTKRSFVKQTGRIL